MKNNTPNIGNLFALSNDPVVCVDNGRISYMNPPATNLFGRKLLGMPESELLPEALLNIVSDSFVASTTIQGKLYTVSCSTFKKSRLYSFIFPYSPEAQPSALSVSSTMRELTNSIKATSDLISAFSLRYEDTMLSQYAAVLRHLSAKMKRLVSNYSLFASFKDGLPSFNPYMTSVNKICRDICEELIPYTENKKITVTFTEQENIVASVDEMLLSQMLLNLLCNSLNHMGENGSLQLDLTTSGSNIIMTITDNGTGIPDQVLVNVFRAYAAPVDLTSGTFSAGLGLSAADAIAKLHGGMMVVESKENKGTRVIVQIPLVIDQALRSPRISYRMPIHEHILTELSPWLEWSDYTTQ